MALKQIATLYVFASESSPGKTYQTLQYVDESTSCECRAWKFRTKTTATGNRTCIHCRHIESGQAARHAIATTEYCKLAKRTPQPTILPALSMAGSGNMIALGRRAISLED